MTTAQFVGSDMLKNTPGAVLQCLAACTAQLHTAFLCIRSISVLVSGDKHLLQQLLSHYTGLAQSCQLLS